MANQMPKIAVSISVPLVLVAIVAAALVQRRRHAPSGPLESVAKATTKAVEKHKDTLKKHKPKNFLRYFVISILIRAIEHERTRKALVGVLKVAQKRA